MKQSQPPQKPLPAQGAHPAAPWWTRQRQALTALAAVGLLYLLFDVLQIGCPILFVTGIPCMGCGMTRAMASLVRLDFAAAVAYHPLCLLMPPLAAAALLRKKIPPKVWRGLWIGVVVAFIAVYALRLVSGTDAIVRVQWDEGLLGRLWGAAAQRVR